MTLVFVFLVSAIIIGAIMYAVRKLDGELEKDFDVGLFIVEVLFYTFIILTTIWLLLRAFD